MYQITNDISKQSVYKTTKSRFYILFTFSLFSFLSGFLWNTWPPIMRSLVEIFEWNLTEINLHSFFPSIIYCIFIIPFAYVWNKYGIQFVYHLSICLLIIGVFVSMFPGTVYVQNMSIQFGSIIKSFGLLMAITGAPAISSIWFPSKERSRATAIIISFNSFGTAVAPLLGSMLVPDLLVNQSIAVHVNSTGEIEKGLQKFLYIQLALALLILALTLIYFPAKPKHLPCRSSEQSLRIDYWAGIRSLLKNKQFGIVFVLNFITFGVNSGLAAVFTSFILPLGLTQKETGVLSTVCSIATFIAGIFGGWLGDYISYKKIVIFSTVPSVLLYTLLGLQTSKIIPHGIVSIYLLNIIICLISNIVCPISFEMACDVAFPVSEEVTTAVLGFASNLGIALFILVAMMPSIGTLWIPYSYAAMLLTLFPLMWFYKNRSRRVECDTNMHNDCFPYDIQNETINSSSQRPLLVDD